MASSSCHVNGAEMKYEYDVFISFRGPDVRRGLLSHLIRELGRENIGFFVDNELERGDEISSSLFMAIEESRILLIIFSKDYASSKWCLDEFVKMMECKKRNKQIVIPIFYKIDPSEVRNRKGDYGVALAEHKKKVDMVRVKNWRSALDEAAQLIGFHYPFINSEMTESDFVDKIVKDVSNKLNVSCSSESDDPIKSNGFIGIDQNITWIMPLLTTESREILKLGIWGMGGIGKTTIASVIFDIFSRRYHGCCFLESITEKLKNHQLNDLQDKLVSKLLGDKNPHIDGIARDCRTKRMLSTKKVLIVLDDVNASHLLKGFLRPICLGSGSTVIVTSRNKQVFDAAGFHHIHKVKELNSEESLKLFCTNAFNESQPKIGYEELSKRAVAIAKGIPLALNVLGSYFHLKSEETWECALQKLRKYPNRDVQRVLRLSYDGLDVVEKKIFLDIAFFYKEEDKDYVASRLDYGACGIDALQEKALITISNDNRIQMHDLIQEMGWEIVRQESEEDPGRRSRLRDAEEVCDVLKNNKGTDLVEGILLDVSRIGEVVLHVDSFKRMRNLRILKVYSPSRVEIPGWMRYLVLEDFENVKSISTPMHGPKMIREVTKEPGKWSQVWYNGVFCDVIKTNKGTCVVDRMQIAKTIMNMRLIELNDDHLMLGLPIMQDFVNMKGSAPDIPKELSKLPGLPKLANNNACDEVLMTNNVSGS